MTTFGIQGTAYPVIRGRVAINVMAVTRWVRSQKGTMKQIKDLSKYYTKHYGRNLSNTTDPIDKMSFPIFVFCLDCGYFKQCGGLKWLYCSPREEALKIIRGEY